MSDEKLLHELRNSKGWPILGNAAADRIEELEAKLAKLTKAADRVHDSYWNNTDGIIVGMYDLGEALRAAKETPHD